MARRIEGIEFARAADCARRIADAGIAGYWTQSLSQKTADFHRDSVRSELDRLCAVMGLRVVDEDDTHAGEAMKQSASAMIPEDE